ncbi:MAG TPA: 4'-phosphopantetheinyl transferase superfamily protein [Streptosporangiaceae bacterium]|nr:4'-phosphopantetheinyl transferase superfamily protein [Streptosporangiaceae bacterium]
MSSDVVYVWLVRTDLPAEVLAGLAALLDDTERQRAAALLTASDARRFVAAHGACRVVLGDHLGVPPEGVRWLRDRHGKPELAGPLSQVHVSVSHAGTISALALTGSRRVGVDVQQSLASLDVTRMAARYYPPTEARLVAAARQPVQQVSRFLRLWARKEACVKVTGGRLMEGLRLPAHGPSPVVVHAPGQALPGPYLVRDLAVPPGFYGALALEGTSSYVVKRRWWPAAPPPD